MFDISLRGKTLSLISFLTADAAAFPSGICKGEGFDEWYSCVFLFLLTLLKNTEPFRQC